MTNATSRTKIIAKRIMKRRDAEKFMRTGYRNYSSRRRFSFPQAVITLIILCVALYVGTMLGSDSTSKDQVRVKSVADGDTIHVEFKDGHDETIRLLGIDTPETHHPTKPIGCFGPEAENFTRSSLNGQSVSLEYDVERKDKYGRTLAYVYIDGESFNEELLREGYAKVLSIEPNSKHARNYASLELKARNAGLGKIGRAHV